MPDFTLIRNTSMHKTGDYSSLEKDISYRYFDRESIHEHPWLTRVMTNSPGFDVHRIYWQNKTAHWPYVKLAAAISDTSTLTMTVDNVDFVFPGTQLYIGDIATGEVMIVDSVNKTTKVITVKQRGGLSSTAATHADGARVYLGPPVNVEGQTSITNYVDHLRAYGVVYNYPKEYSYTTSLSARAYQSLNSDEFKSDLKSAEDYLYEKMMSQMQNDIFMSQRHDGSDGQPSSFGGIFRMATDNTFNSGDANSKLCKEDITYACKRLRLAGGPKPDTLVCDLDTATALTYWNNGTQNVIVQDNVGHSQGRVIGSPDVSWYVPGFDGIKMQIVPVMEFPENTLMIMTTKAVKFGPVGKGPLAAQNRLRRIIDKPTAKENNYYITTRSTVNLSLEDTARHFCRVKYAGVTADGNTADRDTYEPTLG